jgi:hypothetical protein
MKYTYIWSDLCSAIKYWFKPQQKWLLDEIPNTWCDKTELIKVVLFKMLEHYVEEEHGLQDKEDWVTCELISQGYIDNVKNVDGALREVYDYIKVHRPILEKQLDDAYRRPKIEHSWSQLWRDACDADLGTVHPDLFGDTPSMKKAREDTVKRAYVEVDRIKELIDEKDEWALTTIVKNRLIMWT